MNAPPDRTRAELRAALQDLTDLLLDPGNHRQVILDGIRHAWILADLAEVGEGVLRTVLRNLQHDLHSQPASVERHVVAQQLSSAADHL